MGATVLDDLDELLAENKVLRAVLQLVDDYWSHGIGEGKNPPWAEVRAALALEQKAPNASGGFTPPEEPWR